MSKMRKLISTLLIGVLISTGTIGVLSCVALQSSVAAPPGVVVAIANSRALQSSVPAAAAAVGYTNLTFDASNFSAANVDMAKTYAAGYAFYAFDNYSNNTNMSTITFSGGDMIMAGDASYGLTAYTVTNLRGFLLSDGGYMEAELTWDKAAVDAANGVGGWPAFWALPTNQPAFGGDPQWPGAPAGYVRYIEQDYFEAFPDMVADRYGATLHDQFGQGGVTTQLHLQPSGERNVPGGTNFGQFHKYAALWVPATGVTQGRFEFYFDGVLVGASAAWDLNTNPTPPIADGNPQVFARMDDLSYHMILSNGPSQPMVVRSVRVWQAP